MRPWRSALELPRLPVTETGPVTQNTGPWRESLCRDFWRSLNCSVDGGLSLRHRFAGQGTAAPSGRRGPGSARNRLGGQSIPSRAFRSSHAAGRRVSPVSLPAVNSSGCRPARMASAMSGAKKPRRRMRLIIRSPDPCFGGELDHRPAVAFHHHLPLAVGRQDRPLPGRLQGWPAMCELGSRGEKADPIVGTGHVSLDHGKDPGPRSEEPAQLVLEQMLESPAGCSFY